MGRRIKKFCKKCKRILRSENNSGFCNFHKHFREVNKKANVKSSIIWKKKHPEKYKEYQRLYRLKKKLSLQDYNISLNSK